jgi:hypothetical protein
VQLLHSGPYAGEGSSIFRLHQGHRRRRVSAPQPPARDLPWRSAPQFKEALQPVVELGFVEELTSP